jgi:hypothetical protein
MAASSSPAAAPRSLEDALLIAAALEKGGLEERVAAYVAVERAMRSAPPVSAAAVAAGGPAVEKPLHGAFVVACVKPLLAHVLCADASKIGAEEYSRALLLLGEMAEYDMFGVCGEMLCKDAPSIFDVWHADSALGLVLAKEPSALDRGDLRTLMAFFSPFVPFFSAGIADMCAPIPREEAEFIGDWLRCFPSCRGERTMAHAEADPGAYIPAARMVLEMLRSGEMDDQPSHIVTGAWCVLDLLARGILDVAMSWLSRYNAMERIGMYQHIPSALFHTITDLLITCSTVEEIDVIKPMMAAGVGVETAMSVLTAYQMLVSTYLDTRLD